MSGLNIRETAELTGNQTEALQNITRLTQLAIGTFRSGMRSLGFEDKWDSAIGSADNPFLARTAYLKSLLSTAITHTVLAPGEEYDVLSILADVEKYNASSRRRRFNPDLVESLKFMQVLIHAKVRKKKGARKLIREGGLARFINQEILEREFSILGGLFGETFGKARLQDLVQAFLMTNPQ